MRTNYEDTLAYQRDYRAKNKERTAMLRAASFQRRSTEKRLLQNAKQRAKERGIPLDIELSDIIVPDVCPLLEIPLERGQGKMQPNSPSIDRINPELGYVKGNIRVVSYMANAMKQNATEEQLITFARNILKAAESVELVSGA